MKETVTCRLPNNERSKIEAYIKATYPLYKTYSDVIRAALKDFLKEVKTE